MSTEDAQVSFVRSEDLLDETATRRIARKLGLSRRRQVAGLTMAVIVLPVLTVVLDGLKGDLALDGQVLLYLLAVVSIAVVGGVIVGVASAVAAALLINYFFVAPIHTLSITDPDQAVALVVFVAVAALVSGTVELAMRRTRAAEQARADAETMSALAGPDLDGDQSLHEILRHARETFGMESVALKAREPSRSEWIDAEHVGWAPEGEEAPLRFDVEAGPRLRLVGRGPALFAQDQRVLEAFAAAARTAYEGRRLSGEAQEARTLATVDEQRTALLAAVGHDLRTPLAGIKASVSTLRQTDVDWSQAEREELLATIEDAADRLDAVVGNLLDASRLQAGALTVSTEPVALDEVVSAAILSLPEPASRLEVEVAEDLPLVQADRGLLQRVLVNVLDNAIRHGGADKPIKIGARAGGDSAKIEVVDHGPGVSELAKDQLFEPFQRLDDRHSGGLGLGLSVAREFVQAMGGAMVADATPGGGLTLRIRLQLAEANAGRTAAPAPS